MYRPAKRISKIFPSIHSINTQKQNTEYLKRGEEMYKFDFKL